MNFPENANKTACRAVLVTGLGPLCAAATGAGALLAALEQGRSGITTTPAGRTALLSGFSAEQHTGSDKPYLDRCSALALASAKLALADAGLAAKFPESTRAGLAFGSAYGAWQTMELFFRDVAQKGANLARPFLFPHAYLSAPASLIAMEHGLHGYHGVPASGWNASAHALAQGLDQVRSGRCELFLAGGADAGGGMLFEALAAAGHFEAGSGEKSSAPGEGAGMLVLEEAGHAAQRGARVYARLAGAGFASGEGSEALRRALEHAAADAGITLAAVDGYVAASAGGGLEAQENEALAALRQDASWNPRITRVKTLWGETFGAGAALAASAAALLVSGRLLAESVTAVPASSSPPRVWLVGSLDPGGAAVGLLFTNIIP